MNAAQIHTTYKSALHFLSQGQLKNSFDKIKLLILELQQGEYSDRLENLEQNYRYLLQYYISGAEDPQRKTVYSKLIAKIFVLSCDLREELLFRNSSNFEFSQKRYFPHKKRYNSSPELFNALQYYHSQSSLFNEIEEVHELELKRLRANYELILPEVFSLYWLIGDFTTDDKSVFQKIMEADYPGTFEKCLVISALTLNLWRKFDESKLMILLDYCQYPDMKIQQRSLVGICFVLAKYNRFLPYFPAVRNRLVLLADNNHVAENFLNILILIIGTAETEKISKKMREEILPEMMKISPLLKDKMDTDSLLNADEWEEENPEWQEILDKSGVSDKLKELSELQMEGADVYMSTFSMLKSFPFFSEFTHWFMPFDPKFSSVNELFKSEEKTLLSFFVNSMVMCNSDKYSFCLSVLQMPETQRGLLKQSFRMEAEQIEEQAREESILTPDFVAKNVSKQYIQDLFRFFKLYPQHSDFKDMFDYSLLMHRSYLFDILSSTKNFKMSVAEYYFKKNHFLQALELFEGIQSESIPTAALYQKIGYSYQQVSQLENAIEAYIKADLIQPDDLWTVRKLALCYRLSGNFEKALEFYQHVDFLKPKQFSVMLQIGHCLLELGKYKEALNIYFKLDAENEDNIKVCRAIVWCAFISKNMAQADYYSKKILELAPTSQDYLNAGHIAWCQNNYKETVENYRKSIDLQNNNWEIFKERFHEDKPWLLSNGVDDDEIPLMLDALKVN